MKVTGDADWIIFNEYLRHKQLLKIKMYYNTDIVVK